MSNPYLLDLPAVVSFSGGRTSGFMLRQILDAHGGQPDGLHVCFQNTGLEHAATYDFVRDVGERWGVDITWLEYCTDAKGEHDYRIVDYDSASRHGEPFTMLIEKTGKLPNPVARTCTVNLKMRTMDRHIRTFDSHADGYTNAVGLRYDEPRRALRLKPDNVREEMVVPMYHAKHTERDVLEFWAAQPFDLGLPWGTGLQGNCRACFLKSTHKLLMIAEDDPSALQWWVDAEKSMDGIMDTPLFRTDRPSYKNLQKQAREQGRLPFHEDDEDTIPCMCTD